MRPITSLSHDMLPHGMLLIVGIQITVLPACPHPWRPRGCKCVCWCMGGGRRGEGEVRRKGRGELSTGIGQMAITWRPSDALECSKTSRSVQSSAHSCEKKKELHHRWFSFLASLSAVTTCTACPSRSNVCTERVKELRD